MAEEQSIDVADAIERNLERQRIVVENVKYVLEANPLTSISYIPGFLFCDT